MQACSWTPTKFGTMMMPGKVLHLQASQASDSLWALVEIERKWWQFWLPMKREKWISVTLPEPPSDTLSDD
jgi:hypothetical protein